MSTDKISNNASFTEIFNNLPQDLCFVSLQVDYWDNPWQNRHAFLWELANYYPVLFKSPPFYIVDLIERSRHRTNMSGGLRLIKPNLLSYVPPRCLPYNYRFSYLDRLITRVRDSLTKKVARNNGFNQPVLLVWHPRFASEIGKYNERLLIYYKYDNYAGYFSDTKNAHKSNDANEIKLLDSADLIFVTSQGLFDMHQKHAPKLHLIPNGVDYEHFATVAADNSTSVPEDIAAIPSPRIGYVGVVNEKVDFKLLTSLCRARPDWSIVLVGPEKTRLPEYKKDLDELQKHPNAYFLGRKDGRDVPNYLKGFDVCLMCYLVNDWTFYGYPLKMHEYLACGKPSVASDLPAIREFQHVVPIAKSVDDWIIKIEEALNGSCGITKEQRQSVARANSWNKRVQQSLRLVADCITGNYMRSL